MVYIGTKLNVIDNCGVLLVKCIRILKGLKKRGTVGDFIIIVIPFRNRQRKYLTKNIYVGLIVTKRGMVSRIRGIYCLIQQTNIIILNDQARLIGTRIKDFVQKELRYLGLFKIVAKARKFV